MYFCSAGLAIPLDCPAGYFCVTGSTYFQPCPLGTYSNSTNLRWSEDCAPCPGGWYCDGIGTLLIVSLSPFLSTHDSVTFLVFYCKFVAFYKILVF